eukprot:TRINITY_DN1217_c0_g1_i14.p1 TRINITY_DN1217_c0_g1~~TRINITY_DN1217_c0_g1_i14.p1  ORF type:complete len:291 (+),score=-16.61 TRINITY_DN1217_c0_g1_i14:203-1075(+)
MHTMLQVYQLFNKPNNLHTLTIKQRNIIKQVPYTPKFPEVSQTLLLSLFLQNTRHNPQFQHTQILTTKNININHKACTHDQKRRNRPIYYITRVLYAYMHILLIYYIILLIHSSYTNPMDLTNYPKRLTNDQQTQATDRLRVLSIHRTLKKQFTQKKQKQQLQILHRRRNDTGHQEIFRGQNGSKRNTSIYQIGAANIYYKNKSIYTNENYVPTTYKQKDESKKRNTTPQKQLRYNIGSLFLYYKYCLLQKTPRYRIYFFLSKLLPMRNICFILYNILIQLETSSYLEFE